MKKPSPAPGLVIRYDYLWRDEAERGRQEGVKERPCAIVVAMQVGQGKVPHVLLAPITHSPPHDPANAIEIPPGVKAHLGLDSERSWIVTRELNSVAWDDAGIVPAGRLRWDYGFLPPKLARALAEKIVTAQQAQKLDITARR
jgi:hypothetical protein